MIGCQYRARKEHMQSFAVIVFSIILALFFKKLSIHFITLFFCFIACLWFHFLLFLINEKELLHKLFLNIVVFVSKPNETLNYLLRQLHHQQFSSGNTWVFLKLKDSMFIKLLRTFLKNKCNIVCKVISSKKLKTAFMVPFL